MNQSKSIEEAAEHIKHAIQNFTAAGQLAAETFNQMGKAAKAIKKTPIVVYYRRVNAWKRNQQVLNTKQFTLGLTWSEKQRQKEPRPGFTLIV